MSWMRRWGGWVALAVILVAALAVAAGGTGNDTSRSARINRLTSEIRCPTCSGLSVAESNAESARAIRQEVTKEVDAGRSDPQILSSIEATYGSDILLRPSASGFAALVWILPVVALVLAVGGLGLAFRRWRLSAAAEPTDEDRERVARAMGDGGVTP